MGMESTPRLRSPATFKPPGQDVAPARFCALASTAVFTEGALRLLPSLGDSRDRIALCKVLQYPIRWLFASDSPRC